MNESQIILLGLLASALTWLFKLLAAYAKVKPSRLVVNVVLYAIAIAFAVAWSGAVLPSFPTFGGDVALFAQALWQYINDWVALGAPILGSATLIYNLLYERVALPAFNRAKKLLGN